MTTVSAEKIEFTRWLDNKLQELNTDETIFGSYIKGILDSDDSLEEKTEELQSILQEILEAEHDINKICNEILDKYRELNPTELNPYPATNEELNQKLSKLLESQSLATSKVKSCTEEQKQIKEAILSQYSQISDTEECNDESSNVERNGDLQKNINAQLVAEGEKQKREQCRLESQKKKEKDKEDREKQKQLKEEKKEKRKTQKGERKR